MTSLKTSIKTITYLSDIGCLEIQGASLVPEWEGTTVVLREPSAEAWLRWQEIVKTGDDDTPLSVAERARRNLEADVELFIDVLCDTGMQPVFSADDREQVLAVYGPVHARLLRQSLELITDAEVIKKK
ncbi:phage tail assembly chaperone [Escherichia ruysiae]|uniref:phage tail assembly chaperone n=1 Tax=Escherichia ruysiae TaxID=2608867 RepID=UPI001C9B508F|nr:phage tail assembly chaperone [Escherichia ruysiae]